MTRRPDTPARWRPALLAIAALALGACSGPKDFDNENDDLRRERETLLARVAELEARLAESDAKLGELTTTLGQLGGEPAADVVASMPRCAGIELDRLSGPVDRDDAAGPEAIGVYVRTFDGRRRFVQVAGRLVLEATLLPPPERPDAEFGARVLGRVELGPVDLRDAYRSSPMGTHYAAAIPLRPGNRPLEGTIVLRATLYDAITGRRLTAERIESGRW